MQATSYTRPFIFRKYSVAKTFSKQIAKCLFLVSQEFFLALAMKSSLSLIINQWLGGKRVSFKNRTLLPKIGPGNNWSSRLKSWRNVAQLFDCRRCSSALRKDSILKIVWKSKLLIIQTLLGRGKKTREDLLTSDAMQSLSLVVVVETLSKCLILFYFSSQFIACVDHFYKLPPQWVDNSLSSFPLFLLHCFYWEKVQFMFSSWFFCWD